MLFGIITGFSNLNSEENKTETYENFEMIENMDIKLNISKLNIIEGEKFKVEVKNANENLKCETEGNTLKIKDNNSSNPFIKKNVSEITVYLPKDSEILNTKIENGVGNMNLTFLKTKTLNLKLGIGNCIVENITCEDLNINGGVGKLELSNSNTKELTLESGVRSSNNK